MIKNFTYLFFVFMFLTGFAFSGYSSDKFRILADTAGLDGFPEDKSAFGSWLSGSSGSPFFHLRTPSGKDSLSAAIRRDASSTVQVDFPDVSDRKVFNIKTSATALPLSFSTEDGTVSSFALAGVSAEGSKNGVLRPFEDGAQGYLVYVPEGVDDIYFDYVNVAFVGQENGSLSLKPFRDFGLWSPNLPLTLSGFQYGGYSDTEWYDPSRLYHSHVFPYFQIYNADTALVKLEDDFEATNWAYDEGNEPFVYSWFDMNVSGDSLLLKGFNSSLTSDSTVYVSVDSLLDYVGDIAAADGATWKGAGWLPAGNSDTIEPVFDSIFRIFLKDDGGSLAFTVKVKPGNTASSWSAGFPSEFTYRGEKGFVWIDSMILAEGTLPAVFIRAGFTEEAAYLLFDPELSVKERYIYKYGDSWKPLYVKVQEISDQELARKYEYAGSEWINESRLYVGASHVISSAGLSGKAFTGDTVSSVIVDASSPETASLTFSAVDTIDGLTHWFRVNSTKAVHAERFGNSTDIEVFVIGLKGSAGKAKYLTVKDSVPYYDNRFRNNIAFDTLLSGDDAFRQFFTILKKRDDSTVTFIPVAASKWTASDKKGHLTFNTGIGSGVDELGFTAISDVFYLDVNYSSALSACVPLTDAKPVFVKLESALVPWPGPVYRDGYFASVKNVNTSLFERSDGSPVDSVSANDIRSHWKVKEDSVNGQWEFIPVYDTLQKKKYVAFLDGDGTSVILYEREVPVDTVEVAYDVNPADFNLFGFIDSVIWKNGKAKISVRMDNELGKYVGFPDDATHSDSIVSVSFQEKHDDGFVPVITAYRAGVKYLKEGFYPVPYYIFSYRNGTVEYFLKAGAEGVKWVTADTVPSSDEDSGFVFISGYSAAEKKHYLHTANGVYTLVVNGDVTGLSSLKTANDIYGNADILLLGKTEGLPFSFEDNLYFVDPQAWAYITTSRKEGDVTAGSLRSITPVVNGYSVAAAQGAERFAYMTADKTSLLSFIQQNEFPGGTPVVPAIEKVAVSQTPVFYHIAVLDYYLAESEDERAVFYRGIEGIPVGFIISNANEDSASPVFSLVHVTQEGEARYLTLTGKNGKLAFTSFRDEALDFQLDIYGGTSILKPEVSTAAVTGRKGFVEIGNVTGSVTVYSLDGRTVYSGRVNSETARISLKPGIYAVKTGNVITKVFVQ